MIVTGTALINVGSYIAVFRPRAPMVLISLPVQFLDERIVMRARSFSIIRIRATAVVTLQGSADLLWGSPPGRTIIWRACPNCLRCVFMFTYCSSYGSLGSQKFAGSRPMTVRQASERDIGFYVTTIKFKVSAPSARAPARSDQGHADEQCTGSDDESHAGVLAVPDRVLGRIETVLFEISTLRIA